MSSDDTSPTENPLLRGQALPTPQTRLNAHAGTYQASGSSSIDRSRDELGDILARTGHHPTLWDAVGYPEEQQLNWDTFYTRWNRTGPGHGIVEKFVGDTWQSIPRPDDDQDAEGETEFEEQVDKLFKSKGLRKGPGHWLRVADKMATLGKYSVLVLGVDDGKDPEEPIEGYDDDEVKTFNGLDDLNYVAAYSEDDVISYDIEDDITDERFRLPTEYEIRVSNQDSEQVETFHHSRVIHVAQNVFDNPLEGVEFLKPITHELLNIDKILAASAEGYWRGAYQGLVIKPPTNSDGVPLQFTDQTNLQDSSELVKQIDQWTKNFRRAITSTGDVEQLDTSIASPKDHLEVQFRSISSALDAPQSILMGNETGERATQEDKAMWDERIYNRRTGYAEPTIYRQFVDALSSYGILPDPAGGSYEVPWDPLQEMSEQDEAELKATLAQAIERLGIDDYTRAERRKLMDYEPEYGSEVDDSVDQPELEADAEREEAVPPEEIEEEVRQNTEWEYDEPLGPQPADSD